MPETPIRTCPNCGMPQGPNSRIETHLGLYEDTPDVRTLLTKATQLKTLAALLLASFMVQVGVIITLVAGLVTR